MSTKSVIVKENYISSLYLNNCISFSRKKTAISQKINESKMKQFLKTEKPGCLSLFWDNFSNLKQKDDLTSQNPNVCIFSTFNFLSNRTW